MQHTQDSQNSDLRGWIALQQTPRLGPSHAQALGEMFDWDLERAWRAPEAQLSGVVGQRVASAIVAARGEFDLDATMRQIADSGQRVIPYTAADYPDLLRETSAPPLVLFVLGELTPADRTSVAIVGSRSSTPYGRDVARTIAGELATAGVTIVSGLARGVDGVAHEAALQAGGRTIAVLAGGLDWIYPAEHKGLARRISEQGALISEYLPRTRPVPYNFPLRNRIMAGISLGVVIAEARVKSGTLITANYAAHYNREVFAVPGSILSPSSDGCHHLIKEGASLIRGAQDVLDELGVTEKPASVAIETQPPLALDGIEAVVYAALTADPQHIDDLSVTIDQSIADVATALMMLELQGVARNMGAQHYARHR